MIQKSFKSNGGVLCVFDGDGRNKKKTLEKFFVYAK